MNILVAPSSTEHEAVLVGTPLDLIVALERGKSTVLVNSSLAWSAELAGFIEQFYPTVKVRFGAAW